MIFLLLPTLMGLQVYAAIPTLPTPSFYKNVQSLRTFFVFLTTSMLESKFSTSELLLCQGNFRLLICTLITKAALTFIYIYF